MADPTQAGVELATRQPVPVGYSATNLITPAEAGALWDLAKGLAASGMFKDVKQAAQAYAKLIFGRDLGLSPAQSMTLYVMEGKVEVPYPLLATFVRQREGYDYRVQWREEGVDGWLDEESGEREIVACRVIFTVDGQQRGISVWTKADSARAKLDQPRGSKTSNHLLYPRNLYLARAMSNGVKFYVPEVMNGLPLYAEGELLRATEIGAGEGSGEGPGWGDMDPQTMRDVVNVIERARQVGHAGLSDLATIQQRLKGQPREVVAQWVADSTAVLDGMPAPVEATATDEVIMDAVPVEREDAASLERAALDMLAEADALEADDPRAISLAEHAAELHARAQALGAGTEDVGPEF